MWIPLAICLVLGAYVSSAPASKEIPPLFTFENGSFKVNFGGFTAEAGLGGLLTGNAAHGGLHASAGTPYGQRAEAGLGGLLDGQNGSGGRLYAGATAGNGVSAGAGLGGSIGADGRPFGWRKASATAGGYGKQVSVDGDSEKHVIKEISVSPVIPEIIPDISKDGSNSIQKSAVVTKTVNFVEPPTPFLISKRISTDLYKVPVSIDSRMADEGSNTVISKNKIKYRRRRPFIRKQIVYSTYSPKDETKSSPVDSKEENTKTKEHSISKRSVYAHAYFGAYPYAPAPAYYYYYYPLPKAGKKTTEKKVEVNLDEIPELPELPEWPQLEELPPINITHIHTFKPIKLHTSFHSGLTASIGSTSIEPPTTIITETKSSVVEVTETKRSTPKPTTTSYGRTKNIEYNVNIRKDGEFFNRLVNIPIATIRAINSFLLNAGGHVTVDKKVTYS